jgi:hypothetical protein
VIAVSSCRHRTTAATTATVRSAQEDDVSGRWSGSSMLAVMAQPANFGQLDDRLNRTYGDWYFAATMTAWR